MVKGKDEIMIENELNLKDEQIAEMVAKFCYSPEHSKEELAVVWLIEHLVLPPGVPNGYTEKGMVYQIMRTLKEKD